jgi:hypothetical protein
MTETGLANCPGMIANKKNIWIMFWYPKPSKEKQDNEGPVHFNQSWFRPGKQFGHYP